MSWEAGRSLSQISIFLHERFQRFADGFAAGLAVAHLHMAAHHGQHRHAFNFPAMPGRGFVLAHQGDEVASQDNIPLL